MLSVPLLTSLGCLCSSFFTAANTTARQFEIRFTVAIRRRQNRILAVIRRKIYPVYLVRSKQTVEKSSLI